MRYSLASTLLLIWVGTTTATTPAALKTNIYVCTDKNWAGTCRNIEVIAGKCFNMPKAFDKNVSSTGPDEGTFCTLYSNRNCQGGKVVPFTNPGIADFTKYKFDDELRSARCDFIWGWLKTSA